jgi:hypothetical protein
LGIQRRMEEDAEHIPLNWSEMKNGNNDLYAVND